MTEDDLKEMGACAHEICQLTEEEIQALIDKDGIPRCFICGRTIEECDKDTDEGGFNECEWLAEK